MDLGRRLSRPWLSVGNLGVHFRCPGGLLRKKTSARESQDRPKRSKLGNRGHNQGQEAPGCPGELRRPKSNPGNHRRPESIPGPPRMPESSPKVNRVHSRKPKETESSPGNRESPQSRPKGPKRPYPRTPDLRSAEGRRSPRKNNALRKKRSGSHTSKEFQQKGARLRNRIFLAIPHRETVHGKSHENVRKRCKIRLKRKKIQCVLGR